MYNPRTQRLSRVQSKTADTPEKVSSTPERSWGREWVTIGPHSRGFHGIDAVDSNSITLRFNKVFE